MDISSERSDQLTLIPLLERMRTHTGAVYGDVTCDAGYESKENYTYFESGTTCCYIKPQNYERSRTRKFKNNMALRENMRYDAVLDEYTCQNGKKLTAVYEGKRKSKSGFESTVTYCEGEDLSSCPHKKSCTRAKGNRKRQVSKNFLRQRKESLKRITSPEGNPPSHELLHPVREKWDHGFQRFLHRDNKKVFVEILLLAMAQNIQKQCHLVNDFYS